MDSIKFKEMLSGWTLTKFIQVVEHSNGSEARIDEPSEGDTCVELESVGKLDKLGCHGVWIPHVPSWRFLQVFVVVVLQVRGPISRIRHFNLQFGKKEAIEI